MSIGPLNEVIVAFSNAVRRSEQGQNFFPPNMTGEEAFDQWQSLLLLNAKIIHDTWHEQTESCELAIDAIESTLEIYFPSITKKETQ